MDLIHVLGGGLEPPRLTAYAPQTYVSAISPPERFEGTQLVSRTTGPASVSSPEELVAGHRSLCGHGTPMHRGRARRRGRGRFQISEFGFKPDLEVISNDPILSLNQPPATSHQPPATSHQPPATSHHPPATSHQPPATSH